MLDRLKEEGKTIIVFTHDVDFAYSWADYIYVMKDGRIIREGVPEEVFINKIDNGKLKKPLILEVYEVLKEKGIIKGNKMPRNVEELERLIKERTVPNI
ncbi:cobalt/nickel transport system ATP-binding protein [Caldanaerobacter subterraneus subsp. tengcongensis MB4]|uniref:Cobalt transport ATP-binding protein n=1 Tax=Caldanaerobacter subterraneus subsp. tengcongensis (strain DSM 15242 / JCM 11007 / NBRC 100824 / MB4) TaxID=273068 RepID=Q8RCN7_CALS4|nr:cobalt transport ATP-binding protein [Caldanaerobacter subterraneus]AAM23670.1 cobalt transport ATP-binding protein [Caldanaerobacter subterraneus subsp. tengcongensis MB4]MBE3578456.1 hypothetical protein [Caldanaerobacter subterraneus]MCS3916836.1 cobalt/nickel transport system ATP-binding protein [Caldanaerobacter subterraneus subsp. tengcongensis MB4]